MRQISPGIKIKTKFIKIVRATRSFFFPQNKCKEKCGIKPTMPGELSDEQNDPQQYNHAPCSPPDEVSSACLITNYYFYSFAPNYQMKNRGPHVKRSENCSSSRFVVNIHVMSRILV